SCAGARPAEHRSRRTDQRPRRAGDPRAASGVAPAARRTGQVHRLLHSHHAGSAAPVRSRGGDGARAGGSRRQRRRAVPARRSRRLRAGLRRPGVCPRTGGSRAVTGAWTVFVKEVRDALRDRRTLLAVVLSSVVMGPLLLFGLSVMVAGIERAPSLRNFLERQTLQIREAPGDYERQLRERQLADAVVVVAPDFEAVLARGERPQLEVVTSSANPRAAASAQRVQRALFAFNQELALLRLTHRG